LTCQQILGPCWAPKAPVRQDISEGEPGIPMRMALRLVRSDGCTPLAGTEVEVWHTNRDGVYSADDVEGGDVCTQGDPAAAKGYFFRGRAVSDASGKVVFDGCYPGWYGGRALHVHLLARPPANVGEATTGNVSTVTQLYFPDVLSEEVFSAVPGYRDLGQPAVTNASDNILRGMSDPAPYIFGIEQMVDGAMLAWKTIAISAGESCGSRSMGGFRRFRRR
jgi:protocatechuate 3,4-dioxygenase beta subunit